MKHTQKNQNTLKKTRSRRQRISLQDSYNHSISRLITIFNEQYLFADFKTQEART